VNDLFGVVPFLRHGSDLGSWLSTTFDLDQIFRARSRGRVTVPQLPIVLRNRLPSFLALCAIVGAYLYSYSAGDRNSLQTFAYLVTVAYLPWLFRSVPNRATSRNRETQPSGLWFPGNAAAGRLPFSELLVFSAIVGFGVFLRFWKWDSVPQGLWIDELLATANALRVLDGDPAHFLGALPLIPAKPETVHTFNLYTYYVALNVEFFGSGQFGIKMLSILPGCVALAAFYWLLREIQGPKLATLGTLILSMNRWHITHSRVDWDVTLMVAGGILALASLARGLKRDKLHCVALGGVFLGLIQFTYVGSRLVAVGIIGWLALLTVLGQKGYPRFRSRASSSLVVCVFAFLVTSAPVWLFTLHTDPGAATSRIREVSIVDFKKFSVDLGTLEARVKRHAAAFVTRGPDNARQGIPGKPLLPPTMAVLAGAGALVQLALRRGIAHPMTWSIFFFGLLNGILTRGDGVGGQRIVFILPILCLWAAHTLELVSIFLLRLASPIQRRFGESGWRTLRYTVTGVIAAAILYPGLQDTHDYFAVFGRSEANRSAMGHDRDILVARAVGDYLETHQIYIDRGLKLDKRALDVLLWHPRKELDGRTVGGMDDRRYQLIDYWNWRSYVRQPDVAKPIPFVSKRQYIEELFVRQPDVAKPIAFVSKPRRIKEVSGVFDQVESHEFLNWDRTQPLFSIGLIKSSELSDPER